MDGSSENIPFLWGKKRGKGGAKMDIQFYESFTFDNVKYSLYDCVYLFKNGDPEPYIGKIVKIWEQNEAKKVKILWFFFPDEIRNYLRGPVMEREIFLASGEGSGLTNINPLEAIAGKCTVVCTSNDERNRQPSPREQAVADYIFYRFFDVGNCILSDQVPDKIAAHEVYILLNPKDEQVTSYPDQEVRGMDQKVDAGLVAIVPLSQSATNKEDESSVAAVPLPQPVVKEEDKNQAASIPVPPADKSKWFKLSWDVRLKVADEQGTLVYIQNLDIEFGASDIEELIHEALQLRCTAKPINHPTYDDPSNGKAYAIFQSKVATDDAISKINSGLVVGGRPLYCTKGLLKIPKPTLPGALVGHLTVTNQRMGHRQREEQRKAVSTSHCSQPNTIEYELALVWMLNREKQAMKFRILRKKHMEDRKFFAAMMVKGSK